MSNLPDPNAVINALAIAAGFSLITERVIEVLKHVVDGSGSSEILAGEFEDQQKANTAAGKALKRISGVLDFIEGKTKDFKPLIDDESEDMQKPLDQGEDDGDGDGDFTEQDFEINDSIALDRLKPPTKGDLMTARLRLFYLFSAIGLGVLFAASMNIHLLSIMMGDLRAGGALYDLVDELLTGLVIAGGSQPIHVIIRFITTRKVPELEQSETDEFENKEAEVAAREVKIAQSAQLTPPVALVQPAKVVDSKTAWIPIDYHGGVKPESLENRNRRKGNPHLIVYHHTAMSSALGFQAIVDEFLITKKWSTGYHCVIMPDGAIKPFCRWDRVGNHAKSHNNRSLGVSFHGNFHLDKDDKFSNHDGRYGNQQPTEAQIAAGSRLVALWAHLYDDINLDFDSQIMPHRDVLAGHTVCPGSNFPCEQFEERVKNYYQHWDSTPEVIDQIAAFKLKPYVYV
jgi:N-acetyl-anhydromuramyl-L-alanine amidase AmpD